MKRDALYGSFGLIKNPAERVAPEGGHTRSRARRGSGDHEHLR